MSKLPKDHEPASLDSLSESPSVAVIIVTWNKKADVLHLLQSLAVLRYPKEHLRIIAVDNDSKDGTVAAIHEQYPDVQLVAKAENTGGAGGFNTGMRTALAHEGTSYLWLLDNDAVVEPDALIHLVSTLETHSNAAVCGSRIVALENREHMIEVGAFIDYTSGDIRQHRPGHEDAENASGVYEVDYVAACSLLARASAVREVGLWHEELFIYWDDMEWGARFAASGFKILGCDASIVYHPSWVGRATDNSAGWRNYYRSRNGLWFFNNYRQGLGRRILLMRMVLRILKASLTTALASEGALSRSFSLAVRDFLKGRYGKRELPSSQLTFDEVTRATSSPCLCLFLRNRSESKAAEVMVAKWTEAFPGIHFSAVVPVAEVEHWQNKIDGPVIARGKQANDYTTFMDKFSILRFLASHSWDALVSSFPPPHLTALWGKPAVFVNYERGELQRVERVRWFEILSAFTTAVALASRALFFLPRPQDSATSRSDFQESISSEK